MEVIIEAITGILTFFTNAYINVVAFLASLIQGGNYIALVAVLAACVLIGTAIGKARKKHG